MTPNPTPDPAPGESRGDASQTSALHSSAPKVDIDLPDLSGRRALVTGGNSGLGFETARRLLLAGADVVITARSADKGADAVERLRAAVGQAGPASATSASAASASAGAVGSVEVMALDLASLRSIGELAAEITGNGHPLDLLFNNAGVMAVPRRTLTDDGFELQFGTNHLGHFALTGLLLPALMRAEVARVVTMSSIMHWMGRIDFDDLQSENHYNGWVAYGQSKLANLMFAKEFARRSQLLGWGVLSLAAHPGFSRTNLQSSGPNLGRSKPSAAMKRMNSVPGLTQSAEAGALPELYAATHHDVLGGDYFGPRGFLELTGEPTFAHFARRAEAEKPGAHLWRVSEALTGVAYPTD